MIPIGETKDGRADMTNFEMDLFDTRMSHPMDKEESDECCKNSIIKPACLPITILALLLLMTFFIPLFNDDSAETTKKYERSGICTDKCLFEIVESIPTGLRFSGYRNSTSTFNAWADLLKNAEKTVDLAVFYWNLRDKTGYPTSWQGNTTFNNIADAGKRGIKIRIAQNSPDKYFGQADSAYLQEHDLAEVRSINFTALFGSGVLHTKMWIVDQKHVYLGSANMDWKSLTEVKEIGVLIRNCSCIASDIGKIFSVYWRMGEEGAQIPTRWPINLRTNFNAKHPLEISYTLNNFTLANTSRNFGSDTINSRTFISSSPMEFNPKGREHDLNTIVGLMENASRFVRVSVMDYLPTTLYQPPGKNKFWPAIDNAIRSAAYRGIQVDLLISQWPHTNRAVVPYLKSMLEINKAMPKPGGRINIKQFIVPADEKQRKIPFARVNHDKYMVTDKAAYVGTSNWVGDYFLGTAGIGLVFETVDSPLIADQFNTIFTRDWNSEYAKTLEL